MKKHHTLFRFLPLAIFPVLICLGAGCASRSISNSGYHGGYCRGHDPFYRGELSEFDVLGLERGVPITEEEIGRVLDNPARVRVRKGSSVLLIQSGAFQPDEPMRVAVSKQFNALPFTGLPGPTNGQSYSRALRLAAAQAGCETVMCYWGVLESARREMATKAVTWVPVVGWVLPKESQRMRIRLKVVLVDVRTGRWATYAPTSFEDSAVMDRQGEVSDQAQVERLKRRAYEAAAEELARVHSL